MSEALRQEADQLFTEMGLVNEALLSAWKAFEASPGGTVNVALKSFAGRNPGGLFLFLIARSEHLKLNGGQKRTGWRFIRGSHSGTYVRDPKGTDPLPSGYVH